MNKILKSGAAGALAIGMSVFTLPVIAGPAGHGDGPDIGQAGDPANVTRTIEVVMYDNYYEPEDLELKEGETVKFVIKNAGEFVHEFNIATAEMHKKHAPEMMMMMEHGVL